MSKRARVEEVLSSEGRVPAFLAHKPVVDEDPAPLEVGQGLQKMDTVVGDSKAAAEWSMSVITPQDQTHVVESSDDLQIELLGAQDIAPVSVLEPLPYFLYHFHTLSHTHLWSFIQANTYMHHALHNLCGVRKELLEGIMSRIRSQGRTEINICSSILSLYIQKRGRKFGFLFINYN